nr:early activation antigen CD69-like [Anolis sagrei ordinatus]
MIGNPGIGPHPSQEQLLLMQPHTAMDDAYQNEEYHNNSIFAKLSQIPEVQSGPEHARTVDAEDDETFSKDRSSSRHVDATGRKRTYLDSVISSQGYENASELDYESFTFSGLRMRKLMEDGVNSESAPILFLDEMEGKPFGKGHFIIFCVVLFCSLILVIAALWMASLQCSPKCPSEWKDVGKSCYLIFKEAKKWDDGRSVCQNRGGDLIIIGDKQEQDFLNYKMNVQREFWIGLRYHGGETWKWVNETSTLSQNLRRLEEFEDRGDGHCVTSKIEDNNKHKWSRVDCTKVHPYICETNMLVKCVQSPL